jgi:hypothetical protein
VARHGDRSHDLVDAVIATVGIVVIVSAATIEVGDNFTKIALAIVGIIMLYLQTRTRKEQTAAKDLAAGAQYQATKANAAAAAAHAELHPNGGSSFRDAVDQIGTKVDGIARDVSALKKRVGNIEASLPKDEPPDGG